MEFIYKKISIYKKAEQVLELFSTLNIRGLITSSSQKGQTLSNV